MMTQERLTESEQHAKLLHVALTIAHEWQKHGVPLAVALECINNALSHLHGEVGIHAAMQDAVEHRKRLSDLYPEWQTITARPIHLATLALGVWCGKGWRR